MVSHNDFKATYNWFSAAWENYNPQKTDDSQIL